MKKLLNICPIVCPVNYITRLTESQTETVLLIVEDRANEKGRNAGCGPSHRTPQAHLQNNLLLYFSFATILENNSSIEASRGDDKMLVGIYADSLWQRILEAEHIAVFPMYPELSAHHSPSVSRFASAQ